MDGVAVPVGHTFPAGHLAVQNGDVNPVDEPYRPAMQPPRHVASVCPVVEPKVPA